MDYGRDNQERLSSQSDDDMPERIRRIEALILAAKLLKGLVRQGSSVKRAQALIDRAEFVVARTKHNPIR